MSKIRILVLTSSTGGGHDARLRGGLLGGVVDDDSGRFCSGSASRARDVVEGRRRFIEENALNVRNLDV